MKRVARIVRRDVKGVANVCVRGHARRNVRNQRNVDSVKAAMSNVGTTCAEINNAEIYNVVGLKVEIVKMR